MPDCLLQLNANGFWQCPDCYWVFKRKSDKPPHRNCPKSKEKIARSKTSGPGTELKKLIKRTGIKVKVGCKCNKHAALMDQKGSDWCEKNLELIVDWLEEEAEKRGLPFLRVAGKMIVKRAIRNARRAEKTELV